MEKKTIKFGFAILFLFQMVSCSKDNASIEKEGLQSPNDMDTSVSKEENQSDSKEQDIPCETMGGYADQTGLKSWCWGDVEIPEYTEKKGVGFNNGFLHVDSECYEKQVLIESDKIKFSVNPMYPTPDSWCSRDFNMRAEIRTAPWDVRHEVGTEEWFGWTYTFGDNYVPDEESQWKFFQIHNGVVGESPQVGLEIVNGNQFKDHNAGEIYVTVSGDVNNYTPTAIVPKAGQTLNLVVHVIYGDVDNGLLQVWIDGVSVFDEKVSTIINSHPWGGNAKWGIYKWPWANSENVEKSIDQGITNLDTYLGALRIVTRLPSDAEYGEDAYELVAPH